MKNKMSTILNILSWLLGLLFSTIGLINMFWGNDPEFGIFLIGLSLIFYPPINTLLKKQTGFSISRVVKIVVGVFILWSSLGVGELFDKVDLMLSAGALTDKPSSIVDLCKDEPEVIREGAGDVSIFF